MIINGGSRSNGAFMARHLMRVDHNERVEVVEIRGLAAQTVPEAFREMAAVASGTRAKNYFYHANLNTRDDEVMTPQQWMQAADTLERSLGLTDQPRFIVAHRKEGRTHQHVVWSRIDADSMTAISDSLTYSKHEQAARELEAAFGHAPVPSVLVKDRGTPRPERNPQDWEAFRGQATKRDPKAIKVEITALWHAADSGLAFAAALESSGYLLARGDRRDFCLIDAAGDEHSLARRLSGVKAAELRSRLADIDQATLPSVADGRALMRQHAGADGGGAADLVPLPAAPEPAPSLVPEAMPRPPLELISHQPEVLDDFTRTHRETVALWQLAQLAVVHVWDELAKPKNDFELMHNRTILQARADLIVVETQEACDGDDGRFRRVQAWWENMRNHFAEWRDYLQERVDGLLGRSEPPAWRDGIDR